MQELNALIVICDGAHLPLVSQPHCLRLLSRGLPVRLAVAVGVAIADKVGPIVGHLRLNCIVLIFPGHVRV